MYLKLKLFLQALKENVSTVGLKKPHVSKNAKPVHQKTKSTKENAKEEVVVVSSDDDDEVVLSQEVLSSQELQERQEADVSDSELVSDEQLRFVSFN